MILQQMKKLIILIVLLLPFSVWCQDTGIGGVNIVTGSGLAYAFGGENLSAKVGYLIGIEKNVYRVNETSLFNVGVQFSWQGANYTERVDAENPNLSGNINLSYLNFPVLYRYQNANGLFMETGLQTGFLLGAKDIPDEGEKTDGKDKIKFVDIRIPLGVGYWLSNTISLGIRADYGLSSLSTDGAVLHSDADKHRNFMLLGLIRFNLHSDK